MKCYGCKGKHEITRAVQTNHGIKNLCFPCWALEYEDQPRRVDIGDLLKYLDIEEQESLFVILKQKLEK
jgi:hypothetical protein